MLGLWSRNLGDNSVCRSKCDGLGKENAPNIELERTQELVEFVSGVEVGFQFAGGEFFAQIVEAAGKEIKRGGEDFLVGENDVAPGGIRTAGQTQRIAEAGTGECDGETIFVEPVVKKACECDGRELWQMRSKADGVIVLRCAEPERPGADFFEDFDKRRDAQLFLQGRCADQRVSIFPEEIGISVRDSREFPSGHGMPAEEERPLFARKKFGRCLRDAHFGAAGVSDERMRRSMPRDFRQKINCRGDGKRDVDQIGVLQSRRHLAGEDFVDRAASLRLANHIGAVPTADAHPGGVFAERQSERSANQASAKNGDARNEVTGGHRYAMRRPMAGAMMRSSPMSCANWPGSRDCAPSERAWSGSL